MYIKKKDVICIMLSKIHNTFVKLPVFVKFTQILVSVLKKMVIGSVKCSVFDQEQYKYLPYSGQNNAMRVSIPFFSV